MVMKRKKAGARGGVRGANPVISLARLLIVLGAACASTAIAADATTSQTFPQVWLNPGLYSYHFDRGKGYRDNNIGFGGELILRRDHLLLAGSFANSDGARTHYAGYQWRPLHWQPAGIETSAGVILAAFDGYPHYQNGGWFLAPIPAVSFEGRRVGLNVAFVPTLADRVHGAISFQVKVRVW